MYYVDRLAVADQAQGWVHWAFESEDGCESIATLRRNALHVIGQLEKVFHNQETLPNAHRILPISPESTNATPGLPAGAEPVAGQAPHRAAAPDTLHLPKDG